MKIHRLPRVSFAVPMSSLIRSNIEVHGMAWAAADAAKRGLPLWQFLAFAGVRNRFGFVA